MAVTTCTKLLGMLGQGLFGKVMGTCLMYQLAAHTLCLDPKNRKQDVAMGRRRGGGARAELGNNAIISASMICLQSLRAAHAFCLDHKYIDNMMLWGRGGEGKV